MAALVAKRALYGGPTHQVVLLTWGGGDDDAVAPAKFDVIVDLSRAEDGERARQLLRDFGLEIVGLPCFVNVESGEVTGAVSAYGPPTQAGESGEADASTAAFSRGMELHDAGDMLGAAAAFARLLDRSPEHTGALFNAAGLCQMLDMPTLAVLYVARLLLLAPQDMTAHSFLWALAQSPEARACSERAYALLAQHGDVKATHKLAVLTGRGGSCSRGDPAYARQIYDDMAEAFEGRLVDTLGYRGPWQMHEMLLAWLEAAEERGAAPELGAWRALDLGCGSGLCGKVFAALTGGSRRVAAPHPDPHPDPDLDPDPDPFTEAPGLEGLRALRTRKGGFMAGVDISAKMVEIARRTGHYDGLACGDLHEALEACCSPAEREGQPQPHQRGLDLVLSADTFIYVGALGAAFAAARRALRRGGLLAFSTEDLDASPMRLVGSPSPPEPSDGTTPGGEGGKGDVGDEIAGAVPGWGAQLLSSARFAHAHAYIERLAARHSFEVAATRQITLRTEGSVPLAGRLYLLRSLCD